METKQCSTCRESKPLVNYGPKNGAPHGQYSCRACLAQYSRDWARRNPERRREITRIGMEKHMASHRPAVNSRRRARYRGNRQAYWERYMLKTYGLSRGEFDAMLVGQCGKCGACGDQLGRAREPHVDHCHSTGRVRGLLCNNCNTAAGLLMDSPDRCLGLAEYLNKTSV